jgi:predicted nucleic acid-binding protein
MTDQVVTDSGIFLAAVLQEPYSKQADALIEQWGEQGVQIVAPTLFRYEVTAVIRKNVYRGTLTLEMAAKVRATLQMLVSGITFMIDDDLLRRGYELAEQFNRPTAYDSQYLAVAERLGCEFWTADERMFNTLTPHLEWVKWVGNMK